MTMRRMTPWPGFAAAQRKLAEAYEAESDCDTLHAVADLRMLLDELELRCLDYSIAHGGSYAALAECLGVSRQTVHTRHRRLRDRLGRST